jgi:mono/diheme cytochrome c family protein
MGILKFANVLCVALWIASVSLAAQTPSRAISPPSPNLTEQQQRGRALFLQRCSLCHLDRLPRPRDSYAPTLSGLLEKATIDEEKVVRNYIVKGGAKMPGFQYGLKSSDIDDILAFLKTY